MNCFGLLLYLSTYLLVGTDAVVTIRTLAPPNKYKYQISLQKDGRPVCGGSIISGWHILTAAHCIVDKGGRFTVVAGAFDLNNRGPHAVEIDIEKFYVLREYNGNPGTPGDIAVLKLSRPLCLCENENLGKVVLPEEGRTYAGVRATITGYGWTWTKLHKNRWTDSADMRKKFSITDVLSHDQCQSDLPRPLSIKSICARVHRRSDMDEGACAGDDGGPLVYNDNVIIGVFNTGPVGCHERIYAGVYARVSAYLNFIRNAMAERELNSMKVYGHSSPGPSSRPTGRPWCSCFHGKNK